MEGFDIRFTESADLDSLRSWFARPQEREPFPFQTDPETEISLQGWIGFSKWRASLTGTFHGVPCALGTLFLMPYRKVAHHCSFTLMVDPALRRKGIGTSMVRNLMHLAKSRFRLESLHAELYLPCHLLPLLHKLGFLELAFQENYLHIGGTKRPRIILEKTL